MSVGWERETVSVDPAQTVVFFLSRTGKDRLGQKREKSVGKHLEKEGTAKRQGPGEILFLGVPRYD
jgi:hypothetical protein